MKRPCILAALALPLLVVAPQVHAGLYADDLARCLVGSTTEQDKTALVRWIFSLAALHPDVRTIANVDADQRESMNRGAGALITRLLTEACKKQTREAIRYEGPAAMQVSFTVLGQVAMGALMTNPAVAEGLGGFAKHVDEQKLKAVVQSEQ